jgi:CBS domain-containing protein
MRDDVVRSGPQERAADVREAIERSPYPFALVTGRDGILLGRVRSSKLGAVAGDARVGEIMEPGPSTVRPHRAAGELAEHLAARDLRWAIVTTPEARLLGVVSRDELERAAAAD